MAKRIFDLSGTSPAAASTAAGTLVTGLSQYPALRVDATVQGATGGTLDVYLQRRFGADGWVDWAHFTQLASAASAATYSFQVTNGNSSATIATDLVTTRGSEASPSPGMSAGLVAEHPGDCVRVVFVAGASTSAGAMQKITITGIGP